MIVPGPFKWVPDRPIDRPPIQIILPDGRPALWDPNDPDYVVPIEVASNLVVHPGFVAPAQFQYDYNPITQRATLGFNGPKADYQYFEKYYGASVDENRRGWTFVKGDIRLLAAGLAGGGIAGVDLAPGQGSLDIIKLTYRDEATGEEFQAQFVQGTAGGSPVFFPLQTQPR